MDQIDPERLQDMALRSAVAQRCRLAFLHDMRGGLQSISSAFELLNRAANAAPFNQALAGKASEFFRRAVDSHERALDASLEDICGGSPAREAMQLESIAGLSLKFLQNDAAARQVSLRPAALEPVSVHGNATNLRLLLLALLTHAIDLAPAGSLIELGVECSPRAAVVVSAPAWTAPGSAFEFICTVGHRWLSLDGGALVQPGPSRVELRW